MTEEKQPIIGLIVEPEKPKHRSQLVGIELSFYIGKRIFLAAIATLILSFSLATFKASRTNAEQILSIEYREEPNFFLAAVALYLLGVSTDLDLALPLKMLRGGNVDEGK
jgi:hypothetical protein